MIRRDFVQDFVPIIGRFYFVTCKAVNGWPAFGRLLTFLQLNKFIVLADNSNIKKLDMSREQWEELLFKNPEVKSYDKDFFKNVKSLKEINKEKINEFIKMPFLNPLFYDLTT